MVDRCISYAPVCGGEQVKGGRAGVQQAEVGGRWGQVAAEHGRPGASALEALEGNNPWREVCLFKCHLPDDSVIVDS